jgi:uncharacterized protein with HEPN domain
MLENIDAVAEMVDGLDLADYRKNLMLRRAVERCVEIVSEASRGISDEMRPLSPISPGRRSLRSVICFGITTNGSMI